MGYVKDRMTRFMEKVSLPEDKYNGCWVWLGATNPSGRPIFCWDAKKIVQAHRFIYEETFKKKIDRSVFVHMACGNPLCVNPEHIDVQDDVTRFWQFVDKNGENGCWNWTGYLTRGYGRFSLPSGDIQAHRYSYELLVGPIPDDKDILHSCDNRRCVNPDHLRPGTHQENMDDMKAHRRQARGVHQHLSKLTDADVSEIRRMIKVDKARTKDLAEMFGVDASTICDVKKGRTWKWL